MNSTWIVRIYLEIGTNLKKGFISTNVIPGTDKINGKIRILELVTNLSITCELFINNLVVYFG